MTFLLALDIFGLCLRGFEQVLRQMCGENVGGPGQPRLDTCPPPIKLPDIEDFFGSLGIAKFERYQVIYNIVQCTPAPHKGKIRD
jgi:hypothetical protein